MRLCITVMYRTTGQTPHNFLPYFPYCPENGWGRVEKKRNYPKCHPYVCGIANSQTWYQRIPSTTNAVHTVLFLPIFHMPCVRVSFFERWNVSYSFVPPFLSLAYRFSWLIGEAIVIVAAAGGGGGGGAWIHNGNICTYRIHYTAREVPHWSRYCAALFLVYRIIHTEKLTAGGWLGIICMGTYTEALHALKFELSKDRRKKEEKMLFSRNT